MAKKTEIQPLVAQSSAMRSVRTLLLHLAQSEIPVLFKGEKGSGRAYLASYLHHVSTAAMRPFFRIQGSQCDSLLFNAILSEKPGALHIDEIGECSPIFQEKFLQYVISAASGNRTARISCSSSVNIEEKVSTGFFNAELYYRLSSLPVYVPPLRDRKEDIEQLALVFLAVHGKGYNKHFTGFSQEAIEVLQNTYWQGNASELDLCIERMCAVSVPPVIEKDDLRLNILPVSGIFSDSNKSLKSAVDRFKKQYIEQILNEVRWNQTETAKVLDIQRTYLSRLMKELDIK